MDSDKIFEEYNDLCQAHLDGELHVSERPRLDDLQRVINELNDIAPHAEQYGVTMIAKGDFVEYTKDLIEDCYVFPRILDDMASWPYRHIKLDYEAAAEELKEDYTEVEFDGTVYLCQER